MIDPECNYCPRCRDEYRAEIALCAECAIPLVSGREILAREKETLTSKNNRRRDIAANDDIVAIHKADMKEIKLLERELARENIAVLISGEGGNSCGKGCCGTSFYLQVHRDDARDAFAVIQAYIDRTTAISHHDLSHCDTVFNPDEKRAVCPACGFTFQTTTSICPDCGLCFG